jgi:hypothetical protein
VVFRAVLCYNAGISKNKNEFQELVENKISVVWGCFVGIFVHWMEDCWLAATAAEGGIFYGR